LNIPARMAQGYAGGALDPKLNAYVVRESIGHSWPEVYFPGYGWQRFEPTPASYASVPVRPAQPSGNDTSANSDAANSALNQQQADDLRRRELEDLMNRPGGSTDLAALQRAQQERLERERTQQLLIIGGITA